jgi:hypothetical protein
MRSAATLILLLTVQDYSEAELGVTVAFREGQRGLLVRRSATFVSSFNALSAAAGQPVATEWAGSNVLVSISRARRDRVVAINRLPDGTWIVTMARMNGTPRLPADHPHLSQFMSMLRESMQQKKDLWLAIRLPDFTIEDIRP